MTVEESDDFHSWLLTPLDCHYTLFRWTAKISKHRPSSAPMLAPSTLTLYPFLYQFLSSPTLQVSCQVYQTLRTFGNCRWVSMTS